MDEVGNKLLTKATAVISGATSRDATASVGRLPDPRSVAVAAAAVAQLGRVEQEEDLMKYLTQCVTGDLTVCLIQIKILICI